MATQFTIGVFGIIKDENNRVLLCLRHDYDFWNLPGGGLEDKEYPWQGVIREVKEETGLDVDVVRLIWIYPKQDKNEIVFSFACKVIGGEIQLNEEAKDIKYFSYDTLPKNTPPKNIERIKDALKDNDEVVMMAQTWQTTMERYKEENFLSHK